jgi:hypothetical protein
MKLGVSGRAICHNRPAMVVSLALVRPEIYVKVRIFLRRDVRMATGQKHSPGDAAVPAAPVSPSMRRSHFWRAMICS